MEWAVELRPKNLDQMVGQEENRNIARRWVESGVLPSALIFFGKSGTGKTTLSRILPLLMGAEKVELDAASNNSVDDARNINNLASKLSLTGKYKIFIIDEAHMLSNAAWNAMLKSIEEPNEKVCFIFSTTEYTKLPLTIRGRSRMLKFYAIPTAQLKEYAQAVLEHKGFTLPEDVVDLVVQRANGQVRDLIKLLQTTCEAGIRSVEGLKKLLGMPDIKGMRTYINSVLAGQPTAGLKVLSSIDTDLLEWVAALQQHIYDLQHDKYGVVPLDFKNDIAQSTKVKELEQKFTMKQWGALLSKLNEITRSEIAYAQLFALLLTGVSA